MTHALTEQLPVIDDRPTTQLTPVPGLDVPQWPPFDYDPPLRGGNCARLPNPFFRSARVEYPEPLTSSPCRPDPTTQKSPHTLNPTTAKSRRAMGLFPFRAPGIGVPGLACVAKAASQRPARRPGPVAPTIGVDAELEPPIRRATSTISKNTPRSTNHLSARTLQPALCPVRTAARMCTPHTLRRWSSNRSEGKG